MSSTTPRHCTSSTYMAESSIRAASNYLSRGRRKWRSTDIYQVICYLEDARRLHPALRGEAEVRYDDLRTPAEARYIVRRFARIAAREVFPVRLAPVGEPLREVLVTKEILGRSAQDQSFFRRLYAGAQS